MLRNTARYTVQLDAVQLCIVRIKAAAAVPKERTYTHAGLQYVAAHTAHAGQCAVHGMDDGRRSVKRCQRGFLRGGVFLRRQQVLQLRVLVVPVVLARVKGIGKTAPAEIPGQNILLGLCGRCAALFDLL